MVYIYIHTVQLVYIIEYTPTCAYIYIHNVYTIRIQYTLYLSIYIYIFIYLSLVFQYEYVQDVLVGSPVPGWVVTLVEPGRTETFEIHRKIVK
jgi:hypothetical protein